MNTVKDKSVVEELVKGEVTFSCVEWTDNDNMIILCSVALRGKCPYSELFWFAFSSIRTEYGEILRISPNPVRMRENAGQNNSKYRHFLRSVA